MLRSAGAGALALLWLSAAIPSLAGTVAGTVTNGTTGKPVARTDVILLQLQGGMQAVATVKTDAAGHFTIHNSILGTAPMLLRVPYRGVLYHQPVPPGTTTANVEVYDPTTNPKDAVITSQAIVIQPKGSDLLVGEEFIIENNSHPPVTFHLKDGSFEFKVPEGAQVNQVSAWDSSGMPVVQGTIQKEKNIEAVDWPMKPGNNGVRVAYQFPYGTNQARFKTSSPYDIQQVMLAVPPGLQVTSPGFSAAGTEQGYNILTRGAVAANTPLSISVSGTAPEPGSSDSQTATPESGNTATDSATTTTTLPARLSGIKYILVAGFGLLFLLGVIFLWRKPETSPATAGSAPAAPRAPAESKPQKGPAPPKPAPVVPAGTSVAEVEREVHQSLDSLKENLFRLELRRQAGTISEEDYAREREHAEKIIRDLVKG